MGDGRHALARSSRPYWRSRGRGAASSDAGGHEQGHDLGVAVPLRELASGDTAVPLVECVVHVRAVLQKERDHGAMPLLRRLLQRAALVAPVAREPVHACVVLEERLAHLEVALACRDRERRPALVAPIVGVRGVPEQGLADHVVALARGDQQRGRAVLAERIDVRLHGEQVIADLRVADVACLVQRRVPVGALGVHVPALLHEELEDRNLPAVRRLLQQRRALGVPQLHAHALGDQEPHTLGIPALAKLVQVNEHEVELVDELLLHHVQPRVVEPPRVEPLRPAQLRPCSWE
mmetsp:Transcript_33465/g.93910  ORF Transcript_33465/g.93910 Transcript_33465/m.93910 type:complete len:293 (+) Transcript_33465:65-943(+)